MAERRKRPAAGLLLSSYFSPSDNREGAGEAYDSEADLSSGVHQQPERPTAWLQRSQGAFDNLQHRAILKRLDTSTCPININRLFHSLLQNRKVTLLTPQGRATKDKKQGCPQGSGSGPALRNLVAS
ncbi:hypothetical protein AVEN_149814-1 [Araneus ventricosus]|uniref:Uncharacterized protein n=1 Tax=Araneus ventricosus TaxID=182803 RepID=A0A4Y2TX85_ARAVE|nr:hypothetical protein AVEN_149814-1 [Araneus ventricosus]